jgi:hypothetical protein
VEPIGFQGEEGIECSSSHFILTIYHDEYIYKNFVSPRNRDPRIGSTKTGS